MTAELEGRSFPPWIARQRIEIRLCSPDASLLNFKKGRARAGSLREVVCASPMFQHIKLAADLQNDVGSRGKASYNVYRLLGAASAESERKEGSPTPSFKPRFSGKYPPAEPEALRLLAPQRGLFATVESKSNRNSKNDPVQADRATQTEMQGHTPVTVKLRLPPRQSRGTSLFG